MAKIPFEERVREASLEELYEMRRQKNLYRPDRHDRIEAEISIREAQRESDLQESTVRSIERIATAATGKALADTFWGRVATGAAAAVIATVLLRAIGI